MKISWYQRFMEFYERSWYVRYSRSDKAVQSEREKLISDLFNSMGVPDSLLSNSMTGYIRQALNSQAIGRKLLMVEELPECSYEHTYNW